MVINQDKQGNLCIFDPEDNRFSNAGFWLKKHFLFPWE